MDISEGTSASRGSPCFSPDCDLFPSNKIDRINESDLAIKSDEKLHISSEVESNLDNHNDNIGELRQSNKPVTLKTRTGAALTLVNKHPLMSPTAMTPESQSPRKIVNYPDLVPEIEQYSDKLDIVKELGGIDHEQRTEYFSDTDSEPDQSQYQATVEPSFQSVALISNSIYKTPQAHTTCLYGTENTRRKITVSARVLIIMMCLQNLI